MIIKKNKALIAAIAVMVILAAALAGTALAKSAPALPADAAGRTVSVSGNAQVTLTPDIATIAIGTQTQGTGVTAARDANSKLMEKVFAALKAQGVDTDKDVKTTNFTINAVYDAEGKVTKDFSVSNNVQVTIRQLDKLGIIMQAATDAGANTVGGLSFDKENREDAYNQALVKAIENARLRAQALAKSAGTTLGAVVSASENGSYNPWPIYYGRGAYDLAGGVPMSSGSLQVSASVSVIFELK